MRLEVSVALIIGQIIIMNIYYKRKIGIDIPRFWREIAKMSLIPLLLGICSYIILSQITLDKPLYLGISIMIFSVLYIFLFWYWGLNAYERQLLLPLRNIYKK